MADLEKFFGEQLPNKLNSNPDLITDINAVYRFDLDDAQWAVDLTTAGGKIFQVDGENPCDEPGCIVTATAADFGTMLDNPSSAMMLFTMGKLKVSNVGLAISLQKLLN